jgi:hypothetical protein
MYTKLLLCEVFGLLWYRHDPQYKNLTVPSCRRTCSDDDFLQTHFVRYKPSPCSCPGFSAPLHSERAAVRQVDTKKRTKNSCCS